MHDFSRKSFFSIESWVVRPGEVSRSDNYVVEHFCCLFTVRLADHGEISISFVEGYLFHSCGILKLITDVVLFDVV